MLGECFFSRLRAMRVFYFAARHFRIDSDFSLRWCRHARALMRDEARADVFSDDCVAKLQRFEWNAHEICVERCVNAKKVLTRDAVIHNIGSTLTLTVEVIMAAKKKVAKKAAKKTTKKKTAKKKK